MFFTHLRTLSIFLYYSLLASKVVGVHQNMANIVVSGERFEILSLTIKGCYLCAWLA